MGLTQLNYFYSKGKMKEALNHLETIESHYQPDHPDFFDIKLTKARIFLETGKYEEGERMLNSLLDLGRKRGKLIRLDMVILLTDILWRKGDWEQAFFMQEMGEYDFTKLGGHVDERDKDLRYAELKRLKGIYYRYSGELDLAMEYFNECLYAAEKTQDKRLLSKIFNLLGLVHHENGDITQSWSYFSKAKQLRTEFGDEVGAAICSFNIASLQEYMGDYEKAYHNLRNVYQISVDSENVRLQANAISAMGILKLKMAEFAAGMELITTGLGLKSDLGNDIDSGRTLFNLLKVLIQSDQTRLAPIFMDGLEEIYERNKQNPLILQQYRLIEASLLKEAEKTIDRAKAQQIFYEIMKENMITKELTTFAILSYTNMLLDELKMLPSMDIVVELGDLFKKLNLLVEDQHALPLLMEVNLTKAKLAILELDYNRALQILNDITGLIDQKNIRYLEKPTTEIYNQILERVEQVNTVEGDDITLIKHVEQSEIEETVAELIEKNPIDYTIEAGMPVLFFITDPDDEILIKISLTSEEEVNDLLIERVLNALNTFFKSNLPSDGLVERIKHGNYIILSRQVGKIFCHYIIKGTVAPHQITVMNQVLDKIAAKTNLTEMLNQNPLTIQNELDQLLQELMS